MNSSDFLVLQADLLFASDDDKGAMRKAEAAEAILAELSTGMPPQSYSYEFSKETLREVVGAVSGDCVNQDPRISEKAFDTALRAMAAQQDLLRSRRSSLDAGQYLADAVLIAGDWYGLESVQRSAKGTMIKRETDALRRAEIFPAGAGRQDCLAKACEAQVWQSTFGVRTDQCTAGKSEEAASIVELLADETLRGDPGTRLGAAMELLEMMPNGQPAELRASLVAAAVESFLDPALELPPQKRLDLAETLVCSAEKPSKSQLIAAGIKALAVLRDQDEIDDNRQINTLMYFLDFESEPDPFPTDQSPAAKLRADNRRGRESGPADNAPSL